MRDIEFSGYRIIAGHYWLKWWTYYLNRHMINFNVEFPREAEQPNVSPQLHQSGGVHGRAPKEAGPEVGGGRLQGGHFFLEIWKRLPVSVTSNKF